MRTEHPWYRQFYFWLMVGLPATAVVASLWTVRLAFVGADDLVVDEYYKEGLAINQRLEKLQAAESMQLQAELWITGEDARVELNQTLDEAALSLRLGHPLEADLDRELTLVRVADKAYVGKLEPLSTARWHWQLEPSVRPEWRLNGRYETKPQGE